MSIRSLAVLLSLALAAGCSSKSSSSGGEGGAPIPTSDMHINASLVAPDRSTVNVYVELDDGHLIPATRYALTGGDALQACALGLCKALKREFSIFAALFPDSYKNTLTYFADVEYSVRLTRTVGTPGNASVTVPPPFDITMPAPGTRFTDGDMITVAWWPPGMGELIDTPAEVHCTHTDGVMTVIPGTNPRDPDGDGRANFSVDELLKYLDSLRSTSAPVRDCELDIEVRQWRRGTIDPAFGGGFIHGSQTRHLMLTYIPSP